MKKCFPYLVLASVATLFAGCNKEVVPTNASDNAVRDFVVYANSQSDTKTAFNADCTVISWSDGDKINVFHAEDGTVNYVNDTEYDATNKVQRPFVISDTATGKFTGQLLGELESTKSYDWYAIYPFNSFISSPAQQDGGYVYLGSRTDASQLQKGNDSKSHLVGEGYPLYGVSKAVPAGNSPSIAMKQVASIIAVKVTNTTDTPVTVSTVSFTGTEDIVGTFFMDITGATPAFSTEKSAESTAKIFVSETANLTVEDGTAIAKDESATFYLGVKPFTAESGNSIKVSVNGYEKTLSLTKDVTFSAGKIKTLNFDYNKVEPVVVIATENFNSTKCTTASSKKYSSTLSFISVSGDVNTPTEYVRGFDYTWSVPFESSTSTKNSQNIFDGGIKLGASSKPGSVSNSDMLVGVTGSFTVRVYAASWSGAVVADTDYKVLSVTYEDRTITKKTTYSVVDANNSTYSPDHFQSYLDYDFVKGTSNDFSIAVESGSRVLIDKVVILSGASSSETPDTPGTKKTLSSIAVSGQTTTFTQNASFSFDGVVTATYSDDSTKDVSNEAIFSGYNLSTLGEQTVTVSYTEDDVTKMTSYTISVNRGEYEANGTLASWTFTSNSYPANKTDFNNNGTNDLATGTFNLNGSGSTWHSTKGYAFTTVTDITIVVKASKALKKGAKITFSMDTYYNKASNAPMTGFSLKAAEGSATASTTGLSATAFSLSTSSDTKSVVYTLQNDVAKDGMVKLVLTGTGKAGSGQGYIGNINAVYATE